MCWGCDSLNQSIVLQGKATPRLKKSREHPTAGACELRALRCLRGSPWLGLGAATFHPLPGSGHVGGGRGYGFGPAHVGRGQGAGSGRPAAGSGAEWVPANRIEGNRIKGNRIEPAARGAAGGLVRAWRSGGVFVLAARRGGRSAASPAWCVAGSGKSCVKSDLGGSFYLREIRFSLFFFLFVF